MTETAPLYRERFFTAQDGLRLYFRDYDRAGRHRPVLLCLPGLARNSKDFAALAARLSARYRVIAPDYRGRGRSAYDANWRHYHPRVYLDDLRHLLTLAGIHRVVVIGTSLGGILAMALGVVMPGAIAGAVLNDVGPDLGGDGIKRILAYLATDRPQPDLDNAARYLKKLLPQLSLKTDEEWRGFAAATYRWAEAGQWHFDWDPAIVRPLLEDDGPRPDLWPLFRSLRRVPVLAIRGAVSDILSAATFARMAAEHPRLTPRVVADVGHAPTLDEPEIREAIDEFIGRC
ncbi:MAG: alpha/beta hydrolase [Alphaproteobacteria bacterium]|nr:alpha/beta hydrolase [Alphaproteobacteria bacterium]